MSRIAVLVVAAAGWLRLLCDLLEYVLDEIDPDSDYLPGTETLRPGVPRLH